jgi:hypothetical protein
MGDHSMKDYEFYDAISALVENKGFRISERDLSTLELEDGSTPPTLEQIESKYAEMLADKEAEIAKKAADKAAILDRLGLTEDEAKLLLG